MSKPRVKRYLKRLCQIIGALCLGAVLALIAAELLVRLMPRLRVSTVMWMPDAELGAVLRPNQKARFSSREFNATVITNSHGQHDYEHTYDKPEGVFRVLLLGDSYVEGLHVARDELFFSLLSERLNSQLAPGSMRFEFIAMARSGWGTAQQLRALEVDGFKYEPDMVILCFLPANDFFNNSRALMGDPYRPYYVFDEQQELQLQAAQRDASRNSPVYRIYKRSQFVCCLKQSLELMRSNGEDNVQRQFGIYRADKSKDWVQAVDITLACIRKMNALCQQRQVAFVCVSLTTRHLVEQVSLASYREAYPDMANHEYDFMYPYKLLEQFHKDSAIPYTSMLTYFCQDFSQAGMPSHFAEDGHWNGYGHRLAADFLFAWFMEDAAPSKARTQNFKSPSF